MKDEYVTSEKTAEGLTNSLNLHMALQNLQGALLLGALLQGALHISATQAKL